MRELRCKKEMAKNGGVPTWIRTGSKVSGFIRKKKWPFCWDFIGKIEKKMEKNAIRCTATAKANVSNVAWRGLRRHQIVDMSLLLWSLTIAQGFLGGPLGPRVGVELLILSGFYMHN